MLASKSIVDVIVDAIQFPNDGDRSLARQKITECIANSDHAHKMLYDQDLFREFFNWELTIWNCYIDRGSFKNISMLNCASLPWGK